MYCCWNSSYLRGNGGVPFSVPLGQFYRDWLLAGGAGGDRFSLSLSPAADPLISSEALSCRIRDSCVRYKMLLLLLFLVPVLTQVQVRHPVPVLWMMPLSSGPPWKNVTAMVAPAVQLALQDLQRAPAPLGNYELQLQLLDSQVQTGT